MKKILLLVLILCTFNVYSKALDFRLTLKHVLHYEGYYSNHLADKGKETYCGISRRYNPEWIGWYFLDDYKRHHSLKWNQQIPRLDFWVQDFYLTIWVREDFNKLNSQQLANYLFELRIHGPLGTKLMCTTLNQFGYKYKSKIVTSEMITTFNSIPQRKLMLKLRDNRVLFYKRIVKKDPTQKVFLKHWLIRANTI